MTAKLFLLLIAPWTVLVASGAVELEKRHTLELREEVPEASDKSRISALTKRCFRPVARVFEHFGIRFADELELELDLVAKVAGDLNCPCRDWIVRSCLRPAPIDQGETSCTQFIKSVRLRL